jgi:hypothetical protein
MNRSLGPARRYAWVGALVWCAIAAGACRRSKSVTLSWDAPAELPAGYRVLLDSEQIMDFPPPPVDPACKCMTASIPIRREGARVITLVAYNKDGSTAQTAVEIKK